MFKWHLGRLLPWNIIGSVFLLYFLLIQIIVAGVEEPSFQYIARRLLPNECQRIIEPEVPEPLNVILPVSSSCKSSSSNRVDCFRKLVGWASDLPINQRDAQLLLGNRLRHIGRNDLATWLVGPSPREMEANAVETFEYESWPDSKKEGNRKLMSSSDPPISGMERLIYRPPAGLSEENYRQQAIPSFSRDFRKLNGIRNMDSFKDRYLVMAEPGSVQHPATPAPVGSVTAQSSSISTAKQNDPKDSKHPETAASGKPVVDNKNSSSKFSKLFPPLADDKSVSCLRVPLSTALVVIGTIMILTCCCALLLRNRLAACFERLRGKKPINKSSKRMSIDEEQGFMGPRTVGKAPKRSGRKGGGSVDVANVGVQKSNPPSNGSVESDEKPVGCCSCSARKKKRSRRKWKK